MQNDIFNKAFFVFVLLFMLTVPFAHAFIPDIAIFFHPLSEVLVKWTGSNVFHIQHPYTIRLVSDSMGLYIHVFNLGVISILFATVWQITGKNKRSNERIWYWFRILINYYLAFQLFEYGFNKLFKWQFYLPEPNTLFTTIGDSHRDLLYWSVIGLSKPYTIFAGIIEIIPALLLLFKKTRLAGALLSFIVITNIVAINFSYDISVKVYSLFLLLLSAIIIAPHTRRIISFLKGSRIDEENNPGAKYDFEKYKWVYRLAKAFVVMYMFFSVLFVYFRENNFDDDNASRPVFHGAYDAMIFILNGDTIPPSLAEPLRWKRAFVHRRGYFITQDMNDSTNDYILLTDTVNRCFIIQREDEENQFRLAYIKNADSTLSLTGVINHDSIEVVLKRIEMKNLPALQNEFNWTSDD